MRSGNETIIQAGLNPERPLAVDMPFVEQRFSVDR